MSDHENETESEETEPAHVRASKEPKGGSNVSGWQVVLAVILAVGSSAVSLYADFLPTAVERILAGFLLTGAMASLGWLAYFLSTDTPLSRRYAPAAVLLVGCLVGTAYMFGEPSFVGSYTLHSTEQFVVHEPAAVLSKHSGLVIGRMDRDEVERKAAASGTTPAKPIPPSKPALVELLEPELPPEREWKAGYDFDVDPGSAGSFAVQVHGTLVRLSNVGSEVHWTAGATTGTSDYSSASSRPVPPGSVKIEFKNCPDENCMEVWVNNESVRVGGGSAQESGRVRLSVAGDWQASILTYRVR